jgi:energy-coupling factor transporter ATP-binding protein EcfA2
VSLLPVKDLTISFPDPLFPRDNKMRQDQRPTCFISYCREGVDRESVDHLVQQLRQTSRQRVDFLYDEDLDAGAKLPAFMEMLQRVDGVILLLSPEYKARTEERRGGVYTEYSEIIRRYQELETLANEQAQLQKDFASLIYPPFPLIPIILSGSFASSCPLELRENLCLNFTTYKAFRRDNGHLYATQQVEARHNKQIGKIVSQIVVNNSSKSQAVAASFDELRSAFLENTKHEHIAGDPRFESQIDELFVKTYAFKKVRKQTSYLLIGRKGSGKSTIVDYLSRDTDDQYKDAINISINDFDLEYLYSILSTQQLRAELNVVVSQVRVFEVIWELFLYVCCMNCLGIEFRKGRAKNGQLQHLAVLDRFLRKMTGSVSDLAFQIDFKASFHWCYSKVVQQIDDAIDTARDDVAEFSYDLSRLLNPEDMLRTALSNEVVDAFHSSLNHCTKRFLISLDGFDTAFEEFRIRSQHANHSDEETRRRTQYEIDWLRGFAHVLIEMKSSPRRKPLSNLTDFCATIPKDRFIEIRNAERDSYVYIGKCHEIRWSAIELAILLRKRLEIIGNYKTDKRSTPQKRLEEVLTKCFPYVPLETVTTVDDMEHELPIFVDVLRHTFWRPREILIYFAKIIAVLKDIKRRNIDVTQFAVSKCIADTTREIVRTEFLSEFQRHCWNIREIIEKFRRRKQILNLDEVQIALKDLPFYFIDQEKAIFDFKRQIQFLYEIGFLGLEVSARTKGRLRLLDIDIFWFNAGDDPFEVIADEGFLESRFVVHPIFCELLDLDVRKQRLTLDIHWKYLEQQEAHVIAPS